MTLPTCFIVGAQKAGTTSLAAWLDAHPDVYVAPQKEVCFFNDPYHYWLGLDWYEEQFAGHGLEKAVCDATPLMSNARAVDLMAMTLPASRLVAVLRQPVERAYSHYQHMRAQGLERRSFARAVAEERADPESSHGRHPRDYLHRSRYLAQLEQLGERFPADALHVVLFDDLRDRPHETFAGVCRFIGVADDAAPATIGEVRDPRPSWRSPMLARAVGAARNRGWLPEPVVSAVHRMNRAPRRPYEALDAGLRAELQAEFAPEIDALAERLGRDLSGWKT